MLDGRGRDELKAIRIDAQHAPIHVAYMAGSDLDDDVLDFLAYSSSLVHAPHAMIVVTAPRMPIVTPRLAGLYVDWLVRNEDALRRNLVGLGLVLRSALARGAFKAIASMAPLPFAHEHFSRDTDAIAWAQERLRAHAHPAP
jgi:hypothetical protein